MRWKKSFLVGSVIRQQEKWDRIEKEKEINNKPSSTFKLIRDVIVGILSLVHCFIILLLAQFIEAPIRMLIFKGKLKDKIFYWFRCWRSAWRGTYRGWTE